MSDAGAAPSHARRLYRGRGNHLRADLNILVYRDNQLIAESISTTDTVKALFLSNLLAGNYDLLVTKVGGTVAGEKYGLAWSDVKVPEPATLVLAALAVVGFGAFARRRRTVTRVANAIAKRHSPAGNECSRGRFLIP